MNLFAAWMIWWRVMAENAINPFGIDWHPVVIPSGQTGKDRGEE